MAGTKRRLQAPVSSRANPVKHIQPFPKMHASAGIAVPVCTGITNVETDVYVPDVSVPGVSVPDTFVS